jgi:hypothetical protein
VERGELKVDSEGIAGLGLGRLDLGHQDRPGLEVSADRPENCTMRPLLQEVRP